MHRLKSIHLAVGIAALIAFVLTGQYMAIFLGGLQGMSDGPRLLYRSAHLYLMWSSILNIAVGAYYPELRMGTARIVQWIASVMMIIGPPLILTGFATEAKLQALHRPYCQIANYLALAGVLMHVIASKANTQLNK